uniref:hypothetical protein n=1 Tax=Bacteroides eggerthii TaxID=28111 RepID=UPI003FF13EDD
LSHARITVVEVKWGVPPLPCILGGEYAFCWTIVPCGVRGFDVKEIRVNWGMRLNGAVCACWA